MTIRSSAGMRAREHRFGKTALRNRLRASKHRPTEHVPIRRIPPFAEVTVTGYYDTNDKRPCAAPLREGSRNLLLIERNVIELLRTPSIGCLSRAI